MANRALEEIKKLRKKYHLNQKELANRAGVSQSLIAKIEAGKLDPSFTKAQQIFAALDQLRNSNETKAREVMNSKVVFVQANDKIKEIIKAIKKRGISQVPVLSKEKVVGILTEGSILNAIAEHPGRIATLQAAEVMEEAPPIVSPKTGLTVLLELLRDHPVVLVAEKGEVKGIISKTDLLGKVE